MSTLIHIREAAKRLGVTTKTLRRWDTAGKLKAERLPGGHRAYREADIQALQGVTTSVPHRHIIYARVSSRAQTEHLSRQVELLQAWADVLGLSEVEVIGEIGGGMNLKRHKFLGLMEAVERHEVATLLVAHKDRLARFGFEYFEHVCRTHGCRVEVLEQEEMSPEQEMVQDLLAIVHTFSSRLYGLRRYRKELKKALK